eukprot:3015337-Pyramimonas_sp.AAC.1
MEVGIEDCLHIEFEFQKSKYHLKVSLAYSLSLSLLIGHCICCYKVRVPSTSDTTATPEAVTGAVLPLVFGTTTGGRVRKTGGLCVSRAKRIRKSA